MIRLDVEQCSPEWFEARLGIPTASNFERLITPTGKASSQANDYLYELVAEWVTGEKTYIRPSYWMERGVEMEPEARSAYEFITDIEVDTTGLVYRDDERMVSCSPDGLLDGKGLEIKCPAPNTHVAYCLQGVLPKKYAAQVQGSMWVTGLKQWDFMSYHPDYEPFLITVDADENFHTALNDIVPDFIRQLVEARQSPKAVEMRERRLASEPIEGAGL